MDDLEGSAEALLGSWHGALTYRPGPTCSAFIASDGRRDLLRAPNQIGKTRAGARRADRWSLAHPGGVFGVLVADLVNAYPEFCAKVHETISLPELDPATTYTENKGFTLHGRHGLRYRNGARWLFRTGSGPLQGLEVFSAHAGWIDEVPTPAHYSAFVRGVHGPLWVTFTPIGRDPKWFRRKVEGDPDTGEPPEEQWRQFVPELSVRECPWRTPAQIAEMIAKVDPVYRPQRCRGEWDGPTLARRFTAFTDESIVDDLPTGGGPWHYSWGIDHGEGAGKEFAVLIAWNSKHVVVLDEYVNADATRPDTDAEGILAVMARRGVAVAQVRHWRGDANSAGKGSVGESVNAMLGRAIGMRLGWPGPVAISAPHKGPGSVDAGEQMMNVALDAREMLVHRRCRKFIHAIWHYQATGPNDPDKHGIDGARYALVEILTASNRPSTRLYAGSSGLQSLSSLPAAARPTW